MASTCDSEYVQGLDPAARSRYHFKLSCNKGESSLPDTYNLNRWMNRWTNNPSSWPDLTFGDLYTYLIKTPGIYTKEILKDLESLEAYWFVISGHVKPLWFQCHSAGDNIPYCFIIKGKVIDSSLVLPEDDEEYIKNCPARYSI